jgi:protease I
MEVMIGMKLLLVIAPDKFRDEELLVPREIFDSIDLEYDIASVRKGTCTGMLGATAEAALTIGEADEGTYDGIVIVGGLGSQDYLWENSELHRLVKVFAEKVKLVAAICLSPVVLAKAGILKGRQATVFRSPASVREMEMGGAQLLDVAVVSDMNIITASGPTAAAAFAEAIVEKLGC